jgi:hypothetical protein
MKNFTVKIRIFLWLILAGVTGWLLYMAVAPSGKISYVADFTSRSYFIGKLTPEERLTPVEGDMPLSRIIIGDPVYFSLRTARRFDKAKLTLKYRQSEDAPPIIEAGVLADKIIWRYDLQPIENKIIGRLAFVWDVKKENGLILLQRNNSASTTKYDSVSEFLNNPPARDQIVLYNYDLESEFILDNYAPLKAKEKPDLSSIDCALRGAYQFYTYIKDEDLDFTFDFIDINKNKDSDPIDLNLYYGNQIIDTRHLDDDGIANNSGKESGTRRLSLKAANLPEGVYKVELRANDDVITEEITTKQSKLSFAAKIRLAGDGAKNISLFTDSNEISAQTVNPGSLQKIKIGDNEMDINQTYKQFNVATGQGVKEIKLEKDDVILAGNGVFGFSQEALVNPAFKKVDGKLDINSVNYILAKYEIPAEENGWKIAQAEFDLSGAYREQGQYNFLISIPGLRADDEIDDEIKIDEIKIELEGKSLWEKIFKNFK